MAIINFTEPYDLIPVKPSWPVKGRLSRLSVTNFSDDRQRRGRTKGSVVQINELFWRDASVEDLTLLVNFWNDHLGVKPVSWSDPSYNQIRNGFIISELSWNQSAFNAFNVRGAFEFNFTFEPTNSNSLPLNPSAIITTSIQKTTSTLFSDTRQRYSRSRGLPYSNFSLTFANKSISELTAMQSFWSSFYPEGLIVWSDPSTGYNWEGYITGEIEWDFLSICSIQIQMPIEMVRVGQDENGVPGSIPWPT
jgi:hypothetical protein